MILRLPISFLAVLTMSAADLTGIWTGQIPGRRGDLLDIAFQLKHTGNQLTGKLYGDYQSTPISEGIVAGDLVTFVVVGAEQAGNQINRSRLRFTGRFVDGELELTRDRESSADAFNGANVQSRPAPKPSFRLKRML